jgi:hypothetical protein
VVTDVVSSSSNDRFQKRGHHRWGKSGMPPFHPVPTSDRAGARSGVGHEERFPSPSLSGRCRLGEATFAGMGGKEEDAPIPDLRRVPINWPRRSTRPCHSLSRAPSPTGLKIGRGEFCHQTRRLRDARSAWCGKRSLDARSSHFARTRSETRTAGCIIVRPRP